MCRRLFVYGTLAPGREPPHLRDVTARMVAVGRARVPGKLFDMGLYPAALLEESAEGAGPADHANWVAGQVFELPRDDTLWERLDDYEGVDSRQPTAGLFRRERCVARLDNGNEVECDIYVYNLRPPEVRRIEDGRWRPPTGGAGELPLRHRRDET